MDHLHPHIPRMITLLNIVPFIISNEVKGRFQPLFVAHLHTELHTKPQRAWGDPVMVLSLASGGCKHRGLRCRPVIVKLFKFRGFDSTGC